MKYFIFGMLTGLAFWLGWLSKKPEQITYHTHSVLNDTLVVNHVDTLRIYSKGKSSVKLDTITLKDTVVIDTSYTVSFDTTTARFGVSGTTLFRFGNKSTYKLNLWLYPDTVVYKIDFLRDSLKAMLSLNNKTLVDSSIYVPRIEREMEWYEKGWLWFGAGALSTAGMVYLIK